MTNSKSCCYSLLDGTVGHVRLLQWSNTGLLHVSTGQSKWPQKAGDHEFGILNMQLCSVPKPILGLRSVLNVKIEWQNLDTQRKTHIIFVGWFISLFLWLPTKNTELKAANNGNPKRQNPAERLHPKAWRQQPWCLWRTKRDWCVDDIIFDESSHHANGEQHLF